jgi:hypothetical protein
VLLAMAIVVLQRIALVLERIERFTFNFPAGSPSSHDRFHRVWIELKISDRTEYGLLTLLIAVLKWVDNS